MHNKYNNKFNTIGDFIREELLDPMNLSVNGVARACGMHQPTLKRIVDGEITLSLDNARRLEQYFGFSDGYLSRMQLGFESIRVNCDKQLAGNSNTLFLLLSNRHNLCQWTLIQSSVCSVTSTTSLLTDFLVASVDIDARLFGHFNQFYNPAALG